MISKLEALDMLEETHVYLTVAAARDIQEAFGMKPRTQKVPANTGSFKGLWVEGAKPGELVEGYSSHDLADAIAAHLGLSVPPLQGRGSRQRAAVAAIWESLRASL